MSNYPIRSYNSVYTCVLGSYVLYVVNLLLTITYV